MIIHGHRGSRGTSPENTIASFEAARDAGCRFIELDVHLCADGELIVHHDLEVSGKLCLDAQGAPVHPPVALSRLTLAEIRAYDCGSIRLPAFPEQKLAPGARIPTLREVMEWKRASAPELALNVEIKSGSAPAAELAERAVGLIQEFDLTAETLVQSFDFSIVRAVAALEPALKLSCLFEDAQDFAAVAVQNGARVAAVHYPLLNAANVARIQAEGLEALPWTVNEPADWRRLISLGIRSIITDYPSRLALFTSN